MVSNDASNMVMPVGPMYGNGGGGMFGGNNGDWGLPCRSPGADEQRSE